MIQSQIRIGAKDYYSCKLTIEYPVKVSIIAINGPVGFGFIESNQSKQIENYITALSSSSKVLSVEITNKSENVYWTRVTHKLDNPSIHETILESGNVTFLPIIIEGGWQYHSVFSPNATAFRSLIQDLMKTGYTLKILKSSSIPYYKKAQTLTQKQMDAFSLAMNSEYYAIPRKAKLGDIAQKLGIKRVAMQERLRRAELKIFEKFAIEQLL
ncbi:MAG: helix-turn-helix domain-containing protein [Candidatus Kariarchaeaceae archaeon]|jgi:predicted DNA binding protein